MTRHRSRRRRSRDNTDLYMSARRVRCRQCRVLVVTDARDERGRCPSCSGQLALFADRHLPEDWSNPA